VTRVTPAESAALRGVGAGHSGEEASWCAYERGFCVATKPDDWVMV